MRLINTVSCISSVGKTSISLENIKTQKTKDPYHAQSNFIPILENMPQSWHNIFLVIIRQIFHIDPIKLTKFRYRLCIPELVFTFGSLINILCWALACREQLHCSLDVLKLLHWNGWILHTQTNRTGSLLSTFTLWIVVQTLSFLLLLPILTGNSSHHG